TSAAKNDDPIPASNSGPSPTLGQRGRSSSSASSEAGVASRSAMKAAGSTRRTYRADPSGESVGNEQRGQRSVGDVAPVREVMDRVGVLVQLLCNPERHQQSIVDRVHGAIRVERRGSRRSIEPL